MKKDDKSKAPAAGANKIIINPPEKAPKERQAQVNERFEQAALIGQKVGLVIQAKATKSHLPEETLRKVFVRGAKQFDAVSEEHLSRDQYAMNRVNSFTAGGAALVEDHDLIPVMEKVGMKGTGGAMRPHIKREKSPFNNKVIFYVLDSQGHVKFSTQDELAAKKHLAMKYDAYMAQ